MAWLVLLAVLQGSPEEAEAAVERLVTVDAPQPGVDPYAAPGHVRGEVHPAFEDLVRMGPAAIPALLAHLDDARPTRLRIEPKAGVRLYARSEVPDGRPRADPFDLPKVGPELESHDVTVGDCCFAILGAIVNRPYAAVRYQPTALAYVSSPTRDPALAARVRALWKDRSLRDSLPADLRDAPSHLQAGAAVRLLRYYPDCAPLVAERVPAFAESRVLSGVLAEGHPLVREAWLALLEPRGKLAEEALLAARPPLDEEARAKVRAVALATWEPAVLIAAAGLLPEERDAEIVARLELALARSRAPETSRRLLALLASCGEAERIFRAHVARLGADGALDALAALENEPAPRVVFALAPSLLASEQARVRDAAAALLARADPSLAFDADAPRERRDAQIAAMRAALEAR